MLTTLCTAPHKIEIREAPRPDPGPGEVIVRVRRCGICGSDLHFYHGALPAPPVCPGHEISGEVAEAGHEVKSVKAGDRVVVEPLVVCRECNFCRTGNYQLCPELRILGNLRDGGFAEYVKVPDYTLFSLPDTLDFDTGALAEPLSVAVHAIRLADVRLGDRVLVQGAGTIGLMAVAAAYAAGAGEIWITVRHPQQADAAIRLGASRIFSGSQAAQELAQAAEEKPVDVVVETVGGTADTLLEAGQIVRRGGTIIVLGLFTGPTAFNPLLMVVRETRLIGSMTYGRSTGRADFETALQLLCRWQDVFRSLVTHRFPLQEINLGFATAADKKKGSIKVAIEM